MTPQIKNWKTTIAGALLAGLLAIQTANPDDWKTWILPFSFAVLGFLARDADKSSEQSR